MKFKISRRALTEMMEHEKTCFESCFRENGIDQNLLRRTLKESMWLKAGILRDRESLNRNRDIDPTPKNLQS